MAKKQARLTKRETRAVAAQSSSPASSSVNPVIKQMARICEALPNPLKPYFTDSTCMLAKKKITFINESITLAEQLLASDSLSANDRMLCSLVFWFCNDTLFLNAFNKGALDDMYRYAAIKEVHSDALWTIIRKYVTDLNSFSPATRQKLYQHIGNFTHTMIRTQALLSHFLSHKALKNPALWPEVQTLYEQSKQHVAKLHSLVRDLESQPERLQKIEQLSRPALLNLKQKTLLMQFTCIIDLTENLLKSIGCSLIDEGYYPLTISDQGLQLLPGLDVHSIETDYARLMNAFRKNQSMFDSEACQSVIRAWICHPLRLKLLLNALIRFIETNKTRSTPAFLDVDKSGNTDNEYIEACILSVTFFFKLLQHATTHEQLVVRNAVLDIAWQYQLLNANWINLTERPEQINAGNYFKNRQNCFTLFGTINSSLITLFRLLLDKQPVPGFDGTKIRSRYLKNMAQYLSKAISIQYNFLLNQLYLNELDHIRQYIKNIEAMQALMESIRVSAQVNIPEADEDDPFEIPDTIQQCIQVLLPHISPPFSPSLHLAQKLYQNEALFLRNLTAEASTAVDPAAYARYENVYQLLITQFSAQETLTELAWHSGHHVIDLLTTAFPGSRAQRIVMLYTLESCLQLCLFNVDRASTPDLLLKKQIKIFLTHIESAVQSWSASIEQQEKPRVAVILDLLALPFSKDNLEKLNTGLMEFEEDFQRVSFHFTLVTDIKTLARKADISLLCKVLQQLAVIPEAKLSRDILFCCLVSSILSNYQTWSPAYSKRIHNSMNAALDLMPDFAECLSFDKVLKNESGDFMAWFLREASLWYEEGDVERARASVRATRSRLANIATTLDAATFFKLAQLVACCEQLVNTPDSFPDLLAFLRAPHVPDTSISEFLPTPRDDGATDLQLLARFQNAWFALSANAGKVHTQEEALVIYKAWKTEFQRYSNVKTTTTLLLQHWADHFKHCCKQLKAAIPAPHSPEPSTSSPKHRDAPVKVKPVSQRLREIQTFNQKSLERSALPRPVKVPKHRKASRKAKPLESVASSSEAPSLLPASYRHPDLVQDILSKLAENGYLAYLIGGYVRDTLLGMQPHDADIISNCPAEVLVQIFPSARKNASYPGVFHCSDRKKLVVDIICRSGDSIQALVANFDFTVNCMGISHDKRLHIPFESCLSDLAAKSLRTLDPFDESMSTDPARLWRFIRLSNQLHWPLNQADRDAIQRNAGHLYKVPFSSFWKNFHKCFRANEQVAWENLQVFLDLDLLPFIFHASPNAPALTPALRKFIEATFRQILDSCEGNRQRALLALFALTLPGKPDQIQEQVRKWLDQHVAAEPDNTKLLLLNKVLLMQIKQYYNRSPLSRLSGDSPHYNPLGTLSRLLCQENKLMAQNGQAAIAFFLTCFRSCFLNNRAHAGNMLEEVLRLNLIPQFFNDALPVQLVRETTQAFIRQEFEGIFNGPEDTRLIDMLALFSLTLEQTLPKTIKMMQRWLCMLSVADEAKKYALPLQDGLTERIGLLYSRLERSVVSAPVMSMAHRFFDTKAACSSGSIIYRPPEP